MYKYPIIKPSGRERAQPTDLDHVVFDIKICQKSVEDQNKFVDLYEKKEMKAPMNSEEVTQYMKYALRTFKRGEKSLVEVAHDSPRDDEPLKNLLKNSTSEQKYDPSKDLFMEINLIRMVKVKDLKRDGKILLKHIRIGKGENVKESSAVKARLRVLVDDSQILNYYPEKDPKMTEDAENHADAPYDLHGSEDLFPLSVK